MSQLAKQTIEIPNDIYESMLKVFIKLALKKKNGSQNVNKVAQSSKNGNAFRELNIS